MAYMEALLRDLLAPRTSWQMALFALMVPFTGFVFMTFWLMEESEGTLGDWAYMTTLIALVGVGISAATKVPSTPKASKPPRPS